MELRHPLLLIALFIIIAIVLLISFFKKHRHIEFKTGSKIANTEFIKNTKYFKRKFHRYQAIVAIINTCCILALIVSAILIARPVSSDTIDESDYSRDIFLCMDVSASVDALNMDLVTNLQDTVKSLQGERFGISIFNASSIMLVPLTDDYDYILDVLNQIKESIEFNNSDFYTIYDDERYFYLKNYIVSGTIENAESRGSSLIGDGLASCIYGFPETDEERTRIIIFSTDNDLAGQPLISLDEAANLALKKSVQVFGVGTALMHPQDEQSMRRAVEKTQGKFYMQEKSGTVESIVNDIEKTNKTLLKNQAPTVNQYDTPTVPFIIMLITICTLLILNIGVLR